MSLQLQQDLAAMGVTVIEDEDMITLRCGRKERVFSTLGVTRERLLEEGEEMAKEMAMNERMRSWKRHVRNRGRRRHG